MKVLIDTCTFIWFVADAPELSANARAAIINPENEVYPARFLPGKFRGSMRGGSWLCHRGPKL